MSAKRNPCPGLNPYLQQLWSDVHTRLVTYIADALLAELPDDLTARTEERIAVEAERPVGFRGDVAVVESWREGVAPVWQPESGAAGVALAEPLVFVLEPETERFLEIRDTDGTLVTVIEVLSPANKRGRGLATYLAKQEALLAAEVNLVEIDLVRGGEHATAISLAMLEGKIPCGTWHHVCVARAAGVNFLRREVYLAPLRQPLPAIRVPLRQHDPDVPLALQPLLDRCYENGRYWQLDYAPAPTPPLAAEDEPWLDEKLRAAGLR